MPENDASNSASSGASGAGSSISPACSEARQSVEKIIRRDFEDPAEIVQTGRAHPVGPAFVFLHLLEGQPQRVAELFLRHAKDGTALPDARPDMHIHRAGAGVTHRALSHAGPGPAG